MSDDLKERELTKLLQASIEKTRNWAREGWTVTFGPRNYEVNSIEAAQNLPREFPYREEALGYWTNVECIAEEVESRLKKGLEALEQGDLKSAENQIYAAQYVEKPLEKFTNTSKPIFDRIHQA